jgi:UDP-N-acetylmuramyl pentapeptide synthase
LPTIKGTKFLFSNQDKDYELNIQRPLPNLYAYSILLSIAAAKAVGVEILESIKIIEDKFDLPGGRLSVFQGVKDTLIIDSTYNNSLEAISSILEMVSKISDSRRRVGIIGDIREQGDQAKDLHEKMAEEIMQNLDMAILIGPLTSRFVYPVLKEHKFNCESFETYTKAIDFILKNINNNDLILVKGSQNTLFLERVVEMLLKNKDDVKKLCRRGIFWDKKRASTS